MANVISLVLDVAVVNGFGLPKCIMTWHTFVSEPRMKVTWNENIAKT